MVDHTDLVEVDVCPPEQAASPVDVRPPEQTVRPEDGCKGSVAVAKGQEVPIDTTKVDWHDTYIAGGMWRLETPIMFKVGF